MHICQLEHHPLLCGCDCHLWIWNIFIYISNIYIYIYYIFCHAGASSFRPEVVGAAATQQCTLGAGPWRPAAPQECSSSTCIGRCCCHCHRHCPSCCGCCCTLCGVVDGAHYQCTHWGYCAGLTWCVWWTELGLLHNTYYSPTVVADVGAPSMLRMY